MVSARFFGISYIFNHPKLAIGADKARKNVLEKFPKEKEKMEVNLWPRSLKVQSHVGVCVQVENRLQLHMKSEIN